MDKSTLSAGRLLQLVSLVRFLKGGEAAAGRERVLDANRALRYAVPPALRFAHEESWLAVDGLFPHGQLEALFD